MALFCSNPRADDERKSELCPVAVLFLLNNATGDNRSSPACLIAGDSSELPASASLLTRSRMREMEGEPFARSPDGFVMLASEVVHKVNGR